MTRTHAHTHTLTHTFAHTLIAHTADTVANVLHRPLFAWHTTRAGYRRGDDCSLRCIQQQMHAHDIRCSMYFILETQEIVHVLLVSQAYTHTEHAVIPNCVP
jgi:steroid 5-alpha reductase family enzyme